MTELEERLATLAEKDVEGDWAEVVTRAARRRRRVRRQKALLAVVAAVLLAVPTIAIATGNGDLLSLSSTEDVVPTAKSETSLGYAFGDELHLPGRPRARLANPVLAPFLGKETPLLIPSPDGRRILYNAWEHAKGHPEDGTPLLRVFDSATSRDVVLERGAQAAAWRADGRIAYEKALVPLYRNTAKGTTGGRIGHVVVRHSLDEPPVRWSRLPTEYIVHAWAGAHLIVSARTSNVFLGRQPAGGVYAFSGPGRVRRLPLGGFTAVSPDGRLVLGAAGAPDDFGERSRLRVVDAQSGRVRAELDLGRLRMPELGSGLRSGIGAGSWRRDTIILEIGLGEVSGLLVLRYREGQLSVEQVLRLNREVAEATGLQGPILIHFGQPVFVDEAAREFIVELTLLQTGDRPTSLFLTCDRISHHCRRGRSLEPLTKWAALVYNPSRPNAVRVPDVSGVNLRTARSMLHEVHLSAEHLNCRRCRADTSSSSNGRQRASTSRLARPWASVWSRRTGAVSGHHSGVGRSAAQRGSSRRDELHRVDEIGQPPPTEPNPKASE